MTYHAMEPDARALVTWAAEEYGERLAMTSAFGLNGVALIHLVYEACGLRVPVVFVDTGRLFPETLETRDRVKARYDLILVEAQALGEGLPEPPAANCCELRKVLPMRLALSGLGPLAALLTGRGRFQAATRRALEPIEWDRSPVRVNPLVRWSQGDVEEYVRDHDIPYNPLYDRGYYSIGCEPCTRAVQPGEDVRAGRWDGLGKVECGLWSNGK
jgi:phosphoadenosine phosphosulfate reductase